MGESFSFVVRPIRILSLVLSVVFLSTNCLFAHRPEVNLWNERRNAQSQQLAALPFPTTNFQLPLTKTIPTVNTQIPNEKNALDPKLKFGGLLGAFGTLRSVSEFSGKNGPLVLHIQDIHGNLEAQG